MSDLKKPKHIYVAFVAANSRSTLDEVVKNANSLFGIKGIDIAFKNISSELMIVSVTSENSFDTQLATSFETRVNGNRYAEIIFSYQSEQSVYLFTLLVGYHFDEKKHAPHADNFRRSLAYAAYDLTSASVKDFHQSTVATTMVLTSTVPIPDEDLNSILELTQIKQVTTTISFQSF